MSSTVRITPESHRKLKILAADLGISMPHVLEQAIEALRRQRFLEQASQAYGQLRADRQEWASEQLEREAWSKTLGDGLEGDSQ